MADMPTYELTYIINPVIKDQQTNQLVQRITNFLEDSDANILDVDEWGTQRMAYTIDRKRSGYYVNVFFEAPGSLISELERTLNLENNVLRYLTMRLDAKAIAHREKQQRASAAAEEKEEAEEA